ncbi:hypothetical protein Taro_017429 [Colocasia esculenta]|uniref:Aminotransferase-like plant mobile domain-containing protein n=1 Tax=Colocasia esculenta TaxID=4460 RepID=A0A843UN36_COLES|nr:hypothetical protein [Colocasia esculenta]
MVDLSLIVSSPLFGMLGCSSRKGNYPARGRRFVERRSSEVRLHSSSLGGEVRRRAHSSRRRGITRLVGGGSWNVEARRWRVASLREGPLRLDLLLEPFWVSGPVGGGADSRILGGSRGPGRRGRYTWGAAFMAHLFDSLGSSDRQIAINGFYPFLQVWAYLHLPGLRRGILERPGVVVWQPYLEKVDEGQPWLEPARPYFGKTIDDWEHRGRRVRSDAVSDDAYLQVFALKYGAKVDRGARRQVDVTGEIASLRAFLHLAVQDREISRREVEQLRTKLASVRRAQAGASSSKAAAEGFQLDLEDRLASALGRAEEAQAELIERVTELRTATDLAARLQEVVDAATASATERPLQTEMVAAERDRLCAQVEEMTRELALLRTQGPAAVQAELSRLCTELVV